MKNIEDLTNDLKKLYAELRNGTMPVKQAAELNNTAGKIMGAYKLVLTHHAMRDEKPDLDFLKPRKK